MGMFQKVGNWLTDKSDRFIRGEAGAPGSYYASSESENAYGRLHTDPPPESFDSQEAGVETAHMQSVDPFDRGGKDYGGRVPYRSQRDAAAQQQKQMREEQAPPSYAMPQGQQAYGSPSYGAPPQGYSQPQAGYGETPQPQAGMRPSLQQPAQPQPSNVVPFPGMQRAPDGGVYAHIEYIVLLRSRNECKDVIEYIKASASVFLNMEFIASDSERQRCVDMLSGAAYTLGCALNRISPRGIYLISSPSVCVVVDPATKKFATAPEVGSFVRQSYEIPGYGTSRQSYGYQENTPLSAPYGRAPQAQAPSYTQQATQRQAQAPSYAQQATQRQAPVTFGSVMAGNVTDAARPAVAYPLEGAQTGRYSSPGYR